MGFGGMDEASMMHIQRQQHQQMLEYMVRIHWRAVMRPSFNTRAASGARNDGWSKPCEHDDDATNANDGMSATIADLNKQHNFE